MMVLAVDVVGNRSSNSYVFRPRAHGQKPSPRYGKIENLRQGHPSFAAQPAGLGIERDEAIQVRRLQQGPMLQQANVAVAASHANGEHFRFRSDGCWKIFFPEQGVEFRGLLWVAAPGFKLWLVLPRGHRSISFQDSQSAE